MPTDAAAPARTCPSCHAELADAAILCVLCGFHLGLGRHLVPGGTDEGTTEPAAEGKAKQPERRRLAVAIIAGACVLLGLILFLSLGGDGGDAAPPGSPADPPPLVEQTSDTGSAGKRDSFESGRPTGSTQTDIGRELDTSQRAELAKRLPQMSAAEIRQEFSGLNQKTRSLLTQPYMLERLRAKGLQQDDLKALAELGTAMSPEGFDDALRQRLGELFQPNGAWDPLGPTMFLLLTDERKSLYIRNACGQLMRSGPTSMVLAWKRALSQIEPSKLHRPVMETRPLEQADVDRMVSGLVLLRRAGKGCLGIVVDTGEGVTALTHNLATPESRNWDQYYGPTATSQWEARIAQTGDNQWLPASASLTVYTAVGRRGPVTCRLLRFPATGLLAEAKPAHLAPETASVHYALLPPDGFRTDKAPSLPPPPQMWDRLQVVPKGFMRSTINSDIGNALFDEDGNLVAFLGNPSISLDMAQIESCLLPDVAAPRFGFVDESAGAFRISFDLFDPRHVVIGASALTGPDDSSPGFQTTLKEWRDKPGKAIPQMREALPVELSPNGATVHVTASPEHAAPFLLQLRLELADQQVRYLDPTVVYPARRTPATTDHWLGSRERQRYGEARREGVPLTMQHTVNGDTRRYGDVEVTDLCLTPSDLLLAAAGRHFYVADRIGVRRIEIDGFRETVALPVPQGAGRLVGTSEGLLVETTDTEGKPQLLVLDPETLAKRSTIPLPASSNHLLGDWQTPFTVIISNEVAIVFHAGTGKALQQVKTSEMMARPAGLDGAPAEEKVLGACMDPAFQAVYVHGTFSLRRFPFSAGTGLNRPGQRDVCRLAPGDASTFGMRSDGQYVFAGKYIYDLRMGGQPIPMRADILAMSTRTGHVIAAVETRDRGEDPLVLLDRFGDRIGSWPMAAPYALGASGTLCRQAIAHPDGLHFLVWNPHRALWVTAPDAGGNAHHGEERE